MYVKATVQGADVAMVLFIFRVDGCVSTTCSLPKSLCGLIPCVYMHKQKCHSSCVVSNLSRVGVDGRECCEYYYLLTTVSHKCSGHGGVCNEMQWDRRRDFFQPWIFCL